MSPTFARKFVDDEVTRMYLKIVRTASLKDILLSLNPQPLSSKVYLYEDDRKAVKHPKVSEVGWPAIWMLATRHKKHLIQDRPPRRADIKNTMKNLLNKVKWRYLFSTGVLAPGTSSWVPMVKGTTAECTHKDIPVGLHA